MKKFFILAILALASVSFSCSKPENPSDEDIHEEFKPIPEDDKVLSVLFIGNSFTMDAVTHLPGLLTSAGIKDVHMVHMYYGGRTIQQYYNGWTTSSDYRKYECKPGESEWSYTTNQNLEQVTKGHEWDVVVLQEHTGTKAAWEWNLTVQRNFQGLMKCVNSCLDEKPKFYYILSQAYQDNAKIGKAQRDGISWTEHVGMWNVVSAFGQELMKNIPFDGIISTGAMLENLRTTTLNNELGLTRDGYHMDNGISRYGASCLVFETLFTPIYKIDLTDNKYRYNVTNTTSGKYTTPVTDANAPIALQAARHAIDSPYSITQM